MSLLGDGGRRGDAEGITRASMEEKAGRLKFTMSRPPAAEPGSRSRSNSNSSRPKRRKNPT
jgi:hypothetical protein